ncbi:hypothetical protein ACHAW6_001075, partial [Cyclotella cf. meneghiniana]
MHVPLVQSRSASQLGIVGLTAIGNRSFIDARALGPVKVEVSIPNIQSSSASRRDSWGTWQGSKTSTRSLAEIGCFTASQHGIISRNAIRQWAVVDARGSLKGRFIVWIPNIQATAIRSGRNGRRVGQLTVAEARSLSPKVSLA